jgi:hypothetical protein
VSPRTSGTKHGKKESISLQGIGPNLSDRNESLPWREESHAGESVRRSNQCEQDVAGSASLCTLATLVAEVGYVQSIAVRSGSNDQPQSLRLLEQTT